MGGASFLLTHSQSLTYTIRFLISTIVSLNFSVFARFLIKDDGSATAPGKASMDNDILLQPVIPGQKRKEDEVRGWPKVSFYFTP